MKSSAKREYEVLKGVPHTPFEEFPLRKVEDLVALLEKSKPKDSKVEVTPMEDSHHSPCMQEMTSIMVHDIGNPTGTPQIYAMYQYCPTCKVAVRVL